MQVAYCHLTGLISKQSNNQYSVQRITAEIKWHFIKQLVSCCTSVGIVVAFCQ
jgi:hypothetical protein